jgi:hypothetical protein
VATASAVHDRGVAGGFAQERERRAQRSETSPVAAEKSRRKEEIMRKVFKILLAPAAFAVLAGAGLATTPAKADVVFNGIFPFVHLTPPPTYYYAPPAYYYAPRCYWDAYGGRVCY